MLSVSSLNQYYGGSHILRNVSFEAPPGKVTTLLGRNGVGKTTLLKCLMGLLPAAGSVTFNGSDLTAAPPYARVRAGMGYVPQGARSSRGCRSPRTCRWVSRRARPARGSRTTSSRCSRC